MFLMVAFVKPVTLYVMIKFYALAPVGSCIRSLIDTTIYNLLKPANNNDLKSREALFHKERFVLRTVGKIAVFVTFGIVFPPIAVVLCVAFISESYLNLLIIGRFLVEIEDDTMRRQFKERLSRECVDCMDLLLVPLVRLVVPFAALFYGFFVFDIYGDKVGFQRSVWAPVLLIVTPVLLWIGYSLKEVYVNGSTAVTAAGSVSDVLKVNKVEYDKESEMVSISKMPLDVDVVV